MTKSSENHCHGQRCMDAGDLAPLVTEFARHLTVLGHTSLTVSGYDAAARHFAQWLTLAKIAVASIDDGVTDRFARHRCRCPGIGREKGVSEKYVRRVRRFVAFLGEHGIIQRKPKLALPTLDRRIVEFQDWLRQHRGVTQLTIGRHGRMVMRLLQLECPTHSRRDPCGDGVSGLREDDDDGVGTRGLCRAGLEHAVPTIPQWRLSTLPLYIGGADIERLMATCDSTTPAGARDRVVLLLLARLGLRAGDVVALRLDAIDWQQAALTVRGKSRRDTRLPLPQDAGDAVLDYLKRGRPCTAHDELFLMANAPFRPLRSSSVSSIVCRALDTGGIAAPTKGANLLRHSAATAMLRGGATLDTVGTVLRHRSPDMTAHYAKVDVTMLLQIAQPWPGDA
jgi:integrase/recombinase XerD